MNLFIKLCLFIFLLAHFQLLNSCKVRMSFNAANIPLEAKTLSVLYFKNNATLGTPILSQKFTEHLKNIISSQVSLAMIANGGDLSFGGEITSYQITPTAALGSDQTVLNRLTLTVNVRFANKFDKSKNFEKSFSRFADFAANSSLSDVENSLLNAINKQLGEDIFNLAFNNW